MSRWWQDAVFYQVYPRSFADSNGDGIGDLRGIIGKLDYLRMLGVDALWISPFFPSPQKDWGYDIADYRGVDGDYGSLDDAKELLREAHARGIRILLDLVVNHCSDEHPWFRSARSSTQAKEHGWFIWKPLAGPKPNNWLCTFELSSAWFPNPATKERYLATFTRFQPEFDWRNPELRREIYDIMGWWYELGVDGFRLDVATAYIKDVRFRSNPPSLKLIPDLLQRHVYDRNRPEVFEIFREMRALSGEDHVLVGEVHGDDPALAAASYGSGDGLHLAFNLGFMHVEWGPAQIRAAVQRWYAFLPEGAWPVLTLSNHDQPRHAWRFRRRKAWETEGRAKVSAALLLTLRGSPFLYYGEEIAMTCRRIPRALLRDPLGIQTWPLGFLGRDPERTPMQWTPEAAAGFTTGIPWLPINPDWTERNVETQLADPGSVLSRYRELLALRRALPELREGAIRFLDAGRDLIAYERGGGGTKNIVVVLNMSSRPRSARIAGALQVLLSDDGRESRIEGGTVELRGLETLVLRRL